MIRFLPVLACLLPAPLVSQEAHVSARDAVYLEVGGYGGYYSLNPSAPPATCYATPSPRTS